MIVRYATARKKDTEYIKKGPSEIKNAISEINNTLEGINSRLDKAKDPISDLADKLEKNTQAEQQKESRILKNEVSLGNILDNMKHKNICIMEKRASKESIIYLKKQ